MSLRLRLFAHSWVSDWNHGNAHFLRGLACALRRMGHDVRCYEQLGSWSLSSLVNQEGERAITAIDDFRRSYPELDVRFYNNDESFRDFAAQELADADVVLVHEWNEPKIANTILELKRELGFLALFHDTHHRAHSSPRDILCYRLHEFDGVLAFGEAIRRIYREGFGLERVWTFHEAADVEHFRPLEMDRDLDLVWLGNWGDEGRSRELREFLAGPAARLPHRRFAAFGVRYPAEAQALLAEAGVDYRGYLPNLSAPQVYSQSALALHVPRRPYANGLAGIPTIRVFEALACGVPLLCAPWADVENLFRPGEDYLVVADGARLQEEVERLLRDEPARRQIAASGLETVRRRHTCHHRAAELLEICGELAR
jgi:spore maturation protein CgeB